jgi:hypothetical protein
MERIKIGSIYKGDLKNLNNKFSLSEELMFLVIREIYLKGIDKVIYEVLKISPSKSKSFKLGIRLKNEDGEILILQPTNNFYLTEQEIKKFELIDEVPIEDIEKILEIRKNFNNDEIECEATKEEFQKVKGYHMRIFEILNYI